MIEEEVTRYQKPKDRTFKHNNHNRSHTNFDNPRPHKKGVPVPQQPQQETTK